MQSQYTRDPLPGRFKPRFKPTFKTSVFAAALCASYGAGAFQFDTGPDWAVHWDNTVSYNLGMRAQGINDKIGNNPLFDESDYKFAHAGDIVTNRIADLSEFDAVYQDRVGFRVSGSAFDDFAYDDKVKFNPGTVAPSTPYSALTTYSNDRYGDYTKRFYVRGAQLLDAFVFDNFDLAGHASSVRLGRLTQFWGNALIFGAEGINYSQNASDNIKALNSPGTQAKELAIPRLQLLFQTALTPSVSLAAQYFGEFQGNRLPEGGTYLGTFGFAFSGPDQLPGGAGTNDGSIKPKNVHSNFGIKTTWTPEGFRGNVGAYYRHLDEVQPWLLFGEDPSTGAVNYHLSYNTGVNLYGLSMDRQIGPASTGFELSYRQGTALNSATGPLASDVSGHSGPTGDVINAVANVLLGLTPTALYQTGSALAEFAYTHKVSVDSQYAALYNGVHNASGCASGQRKDGCSTDNALGMAAEFDPQWLQVFAGVDIDVPLFAEYGLYGNGASVGGVINQNTVVYTAGVHAFIQQRYNLSLQYNGYHVPANGLTNAGAANGVANGTDGFPTYYNANNQQFFFNDKGWVSLTFSTVF